MDERHKASIKVNQNLFQVIGYYLCEITETPKYLLELWGKKMLSVSACFFV